MVIVPKHAEFAPNRPRDAKRREARQRPLKSPPNAPLSRRQPGATLGCETSNRNSHQLTYATALAGACKYFGAVSGVS